MRGAAHRRVLRPINVRVVSVPEDKADAVAASLRNDPDIEYVERDYVARAAFVPNDPYLASGAEWHLSKIEASGAWDTTQGSTNAVVAVLDSGIALAHPDLAMQCIPGYDFVNDNSEPVDDFGHGTAVSGVIAAAGNNGLGVVGVAYGARVLPVKIMDSAGFASYSCIAQGIKYAVDQGARVINLSLAGSAPSATLQEAIDYAWSNNVVIVAAAGNNANEVPQYPAACTHVIGVSATEPDDSLASFSSFGTGVTLSAPGDTIWTTQRDPNNPYGSWRGTSFASPIVAGVAALVAAEDPSLSNTQIVSILEQASADIGSAGYDTTFGFGRVDAARAVAAAGLEPGAAPHPATPAPSVTFSSPGDSAQFPLGASVTIRVQASSPSGTAVTNLLLLANGTPITSLGAGPFELDWTPAGAGHYTLTAVVTDDQGLCATSSPVSIDVVVPDADTPVVTITSGPANQSRLVTPQVFLAGTASDNTGIDRVELEVNGTDLQLVNGTTNWNTEILLTPGKNVILVRSVDQAGNVSSAVTRTITYVVDAPLTVQVEGNGKVTPELDGKFLEIYAKDGIEVIDVQGEIDMYTAPRLRELLIDLVSKGDYQLVVNLDKVGFLDSTGLWVLVGGLKRVRAHDGSLDLVCTQQRILKIFRITGLTEVFGIYETVDQAIAARRGRL